MLSYQNLVGYILKLDCLCPRRQVVQWLHCLLGAGGICIEKTHFLLHGF
uniref:Uncharacterized protein n=1 Tax=Rhizophora mucronata TaxID=61149 RepID=A0A2P2QYN0_RHIMU